MKTVYVVEDPTHRFLDREFGCEATAKEYEDKLERVCIEVHSIKAQQQALDKLYSDLAQWLETHGDTHE